ncbi:hypothetical protein AB4Y45_43545 [Paraburkholderia sp. EG287A]|uniref:hypothetical protein n=1 Tax=Paraburkholderia TaxID=1822464 RepID=UPI003170B479
MDEHDGFDLSLAGLDEQGVLHKHARLTDATLRTEAQLALKDRNDVPRGFYEALGNLLA